MHDRRLEVGVWFDPTRGYFTTGSELPRSLTALSLGGLRRRIEALMGSAFGYVTARECFQEGQGHIATNARVKASKANGSKCDETGDHVPGRG